MSESVYWMNMNADIECTIKECTMCLECQQMQPQERVLHYEIPCKPREIVSADVFMISGGSLLCIVDYHSKVTIVKKVNILSAEYLV